MLVSRDVTEDNTSIELRHTPDQVWITAELPDCSLDKDDVHVSVSGTSIRIQVEPSDASPQANGLDRTITLPEPINPADAVLAYKDPELTVIVPIQDL